MPVLGGQFAIGVTGIFGREAASINGTLTTGFGPFATTRMGSIGDSITSVGDLYPMMTLKWNSGVHNFMTYATGDIPVGAYNPNSIANIGIGHGAIDGGGGYTYFNPATGRTFSGVAGFTYNFKNPDTQVQSGVDFHFDRSAAQFVSKQVFVGLVGYAYQQVSDDTGGNPLLGGFRSRVLGVGPQIGYIFPVGNMQGYLNFKAYGEFDAANRPAGWNTWLTFAISAGGTHRCNTNPAPGDEVKRSKPNNAIRAASIRAPARFSVAVCPVLLGGGGGGGPALQYFR